MVVGYTLMLLRLIQTYYFWIRDGKVGLPGELKETGVLDEIEAQK